MFHELPPLYHRWVTGMLADQIPRETLATCASCAMCVTPQGAVPNSIYTFDPDLKCCVYLPILPNFLVGRILADPRNAAGVDSVRRRLDDQESAPHMISAPPIIAPVDHVHLLARLKLDQKLDKKRYGQKLEQLQGRLNLLTRNPGFKNISVLCVFEGSDAAGKGGSIRRITQAVDARIFGIIPIAAPTEEERAQPYLWRFWRHIPRHGRLTIFDRSWYGRVLVERVEGFCSEYDWMRAFSEITDFEEQLSRKHFVMVKFWLQISKEEQLRRFEERQNIPFKRFKITEEDWRNREKWDAYEVAVCDMIDRTSTDYAPWTVVEANNKYFARIKVLETLCDRIEAALDEL